MDDYSSNVVKFLSEIGLLISHKKFQSVYFFQPGNKTSKQNFKNKQI